ncbi:MAG: hypothetical protein WAU36_12435 [Cyclobacteriaceae bacterium]
MTKHLRTNKTKFQFLVIMVGLLIFGCESNDPQKEDTPELITKATLTFTPAGGGTVVTASASDPDGEGVKDIEVDGAINLTAGVSYTLSLSLINELAEASSPEYDITEEVEEEGDEHMFFYSWTGDVFSDPAGNGNIVNRTGTVNYQDEDGGGLPIGIVTSWTVGAAASSGTFRVVLKHQPDLKTETSSADTGETDLDIEFDINVN